MVTQETVKTATMVRIHGRVQGVGYRAWCKSQARKRGLAGWVRNRTDGTVEACFCGADEAVNEMVKACHDGPLCSAVFMVETASAEPVDVERFVTRDTV